MKHLCSGTTYSLQVRWYRYATMIALLILCIGINASFANSLNAQVCADPVLVCNDQVNLSIPEGIITIEVFLVSENIPPSCFDDYEVNISQDNLPIGNQISCVYSGQLLDYTLTHIPTGLSCGGTLLIEDKSAPTINCLNLDISCSEDSAVSNLGAPEVTDNCDERPSLVSFDTYVDFECTNPDFLGRIDRQWTATDNQGNSSTCTQQINIIRPNLIGLVLPQDITINCADDDTTPNNAGAPEIANLPSGSSCNFAINFEDTTSPICSGSFKIIRRWTIVDWCTNQQITHTQIITVADTTGPEIICPENFIFGANESTCDATVRFSNIEAVDDCGEVAIVNASWESGNGFGPFNNIPVGEFTVTFTATDDCGNTSQCIVPVIIIDDVIPVAICDLATTVGIGESQSSMICADDLDSGSFDNCELVNREIRLVGDTIFSECISLSCEQVGNTLMVELQVTDHVGLQNHCTVEVSVFDKAPPMIENCAADITLKCDEDPNDISLTGEPEAVDNCSVEINFTDESFLNECNTGEIIRTFFVSDNSGNTASCIQTITLIDDIEPVITFSQDITLVCQTANEDTAIPTVEDNCGQFAFNFEDTFIENGDCIQVIERTWEVLNLCTDEGVSQNVIITLLNDTNLPVFSGAPTEITVNCADSFPEFIAPIVTDICDTDLQVEFSSVEEIGDCPSIRNVIGTYIATDDCGNSSSFIQTIRFIDIDAPSFVTFPANQTISCDEVATIVFPELADSCDEAPVITLQSDTIPGDCMNEEIIRRTYTVTDRCGNAKSETQTISVEDNEAPIIRGQTEDFTISCEFPIPVFDLGVIDNCDNNLDTLIIRESVQGDCPNESTLTQIFSFSDDCGNTVLDTIIITIEDNSPPTLEADNFVPNLVIACDQEMPILNFTVLDNCDSDIEIIETRDSIGDACNLTITRIFEVLDDCGNANSVTQNLSVIDDQPPFFSNFPPNQVVTIFTGENMTQVDVIDAIPLDNCSDSISVNFVVDLFSDGDQPSAPNQFFESNNASGVYPLGEHTIIFSATDICGNSISSELFISVFEISPSEICRNVSLEIGENGLLSVLPPTIIDDLAINNLDDFIVRFVNPNDTTQIIGDNLLFNCDDLGINQYAIQLISRADSVSIICRNLINIIDPDMHCGGGRPDEAAIAGKIFSPQGVNMSDINVILQNNNSFDTKTDKFGLYLFESLPLGSTCQVTPVHDVNPFLGVTTFDLVLIQKHILQVQKFTNPYQHIAADVNLNGKVDIQDLLEIRSLLLFSTDSFSKSPSYRFIKADQQFEDPDNPLAQEIPSSHICQDISDSQLDVNFIIIKMGDVDGTSFEFDSEDITERSTPSYTLSYENTILPSNQITSVDITGYGTSEIEALQFGLQLSNVDLIDVNFHKDLNNNISIEGNNLHFAWTKFDGPLPNPLFQLKVKTGIPFTLSSVLDFQSKENSISFDKNGLASRIQLIESETPALPSQNVLGQNHPNPFSNTTDIPFYLEADGMTSIEVKNLEGKTVYTHSESYSRGWHSHKFAHGNLDSGIYIYSLTQNNTTITKKMVITK